MSKAPSPELLRKVLRYDSENGKLYWLKRGPEIDPCPKCRAKWNARHAGKQAFINCVKNRNFGTVFGKRFLAYRVMWAIHYGEWPQGQIDHINGDSLDNRIDNLRVVTDSENRKNMPTSKRNTSGRVGVYWSKHCNKWVARIDVDGKAIHLKATPNFDEACAARLEAERKYGFHPNHGRKVA